MNGQRLEFSNQSEPAAGPTATDAKPVDGLPTVSEGGTVGTPSALATPNRSHTEEFPSADSVLGTYKLLAEVARGGMGVVFKAQDPAGKIVALKTIRLDRGSSSDNARRFEREIQAAQQLKHPNIVAIHDVGEAGGFPFFTMEFVERGSLSQHRPRFQSDPQTAVRLVEQVARAVEHAHESGILHRDLKPGNILLGENDTPLVSDFGLAKFVGGDADLTRTGQLVGTTAYMSPEQATGRIHDISTRSDIWSLGVILYELLAGQRPFRADDDIDLIKQIQSDPPTRPGQLRPDLPGALEAVVLKCLAKNPDDRYQSAGDLADDLARWLAGRPVTLGRPSAPRRAIRALRRHPWLSAAGLFLVAATIAAVIVVPRLDPERVRRIHEEKLAAGQAVEWIPDKGLPHSYGVIRSSTSAKTEVGSDGFFTVSALDVCLFEFLPDPKGDRFRIRGWVRQNDNAEDGMVGFYAGHSHHLFDSPADFYAVLAFAENENEAGRVSVDLLYHTTIDDGTQQVGRAGRPVHTTLPKAEQRLGTWRELALDVSPDKIVASHNGAVIGAAPRALPDFRARRLLKFFPNLDAQSAFAPRGGLGLYVYRGSASFKSVTITPLR